MATQRRSARRSSTRSSKLRWWLCALASVSLPGCTSDTESESRPSDAPTIQVEKYTLTNGLEVLMVEDHRLPLVAVNLWYHVGPVNEEPGRTGFAHLFEHMMFQGSAHAPGGFFRRLIAAGGTGMNGSTDFDRTNYYETVPADQLELALWLESDRMGFLLEEIDQAALSNEQDVVRNERRQSVDTQPYGLVDEAVYHTLFPTDHPYYGSVIGSHTDIQAATLEDIREFFGLYYAPNNATLALVGDFDPVATRALIERYFGTLRSGPPVPGRTVVTPPVTSERRVVIEDRVELPRVYMAWLTPTAFEPGDAEARILSDILADGESSRLYRALVYEQEVAQEVWTSYDPAALGSIFQVRATARAGRTVEELEAAIDDALDALRAAPPEQAEVERARNTLETRMVQGFEDLGRLADQLNRYNHYLGDANYLNEDLARYAAVTPASIQSFVVEHLSPEARVVVHGVPGEPVAPPDDVPVSGPPPVVAELDEFVNPDEAWRAETPLPGTQRELVVPIPETFELPNGLTVMVNERPGLPVVSASLVVRRGAGDNPGDRPGLASLTTDMLTQGTASRSAFDISNEVAQLGASLSAVTTIDGMRINASSLTRSFPALLDILADVTLNPSFPPEEFERRRETRLGALMQEGNAPVTIAERSVFRSLFGDEHGYGYRDSGAPAGIRAVTRDEVLAFWSGHFVPSNAALVLSGQVTVEELRPMVEEAFGDWPAAEGLAAVIPAPSTTDARLVLVDRPGAAQTELRVVTVGVPRSTPDFEAVALMNTILGGLGVSPTLAQNFSSRINVNLREQHGYTYGAVSQFVYRRSRGPFWSGGPIRTDATAPAVTEILGEIRRIRDEPVTEEELALAKDSQIRSLAAQYQTSAGVTNATAGIHIYDLGVDYYRGIAARLAAVTVEDVQAAAQRHLDPDAMIVVAVGDLATIRAPLEALNLGPVQIRDVEGNVIP